MNVDATELHLPLGDIHDFSSEEAQQLLSNKFVVIMGDSNYRSVYKDLISILQTNKTLTLHELKGKGEETFANDQRVEFNGLHNKNNYREVRQYQTGRHLVRYYFISRVFSAYMESVLNDFKMGLETGLIPDVLIMNSCIWDLNRYHDTPPKEPPLRKALREYQQNLEKFFERLNDILPPSCLIIWNTAMPIKPVKNVASSSGTQRKLPSVFIHPDQSTPEDVIEANFYSASLAWCYRFDVLDLHYSVRFLEAHHAEDGLHWSSWVHRCITKMLLTHMAEAWGVKLDKRRPPPGPERNMDALNSSPRLFPPPTPRQFSPHANGSPFSPFSPGNHVDFIQNSASYNNGPMDDYEEQGPGYETYYSSASGLGDEFGYEEDPQTHLDRPIPGNNPTFQQNGSYNHGFTEERAYEWRPQPYPGWISPGNDPSFQHNGSYDHGFMEDYAYEGATLHPGQLIPSNDPSFQEDVSFHEGAVVGSGCDHFSQPLPGPLPHPENYPFVQENGWHGIRFPEGYGAQQPPWLHMEEIHQNGFPPPCPPAPPFPPPPGPIDHHMGQASSYSPYRSPQENRSRHRNRFVIYHQRARNNLPYRRPRTRSRNARWSAKSPRRPLYYS